MSVTVIVALVQVITVQLARCQGAGGPSTFGYDAASACSKPYSRTGRARLANLPCDFRRQNWCTVAGSAYPWHAVRRFVQENRGLMKRMYGDERHINILRAEFERNNIELTYEDYYQQFANEHRRYQYLEDYEYADEEARSVNDEYEGRGFTSRSFTDPTTKRSHKFPKLSEYTRPHFRPTERTTTATTSSTSSTTPTPTTTATGQSSTSEEPTTRSTATSTSNSSLNSTLNSTLNTTSKPETDEPTTLDPQLAQNFSLNEIPGQIDRIDEDIDDEISTEGSSTDTTTLTTPGTTGPNMEVEDQVEEDEFVSEKETTVRDSLEDQQFRPRPEYRPSGRPEVSTMEGQLYQDVAAKDQQEQPVLKLRGVNACPVKEEVVAPFWANNTRGEVLALLNLYPFEQYVHWEKCTHENKQMYCRDGCRCEQQYRLHRLLAYDPSNECRGIFSDWFKFPSCCVCRCYDLPLEFRVTSRSPRNERQKIKVRQPRSRYA